MKRRNSGATLAFVAGSIIFIVIVALAFYFLSQLLGGARELQAATDSGTLNVAKNATTQSVDIPTGGTEDLQDMKLTLQGQLKTGRVDLRSFNSLVGAALLVAMNSEADGNTEALTNARTFIDLVEGQSGSAGQSLKSLLSNGDGWAKNFFDQTANGNSLRMLGDSPNLAWQSGDFRVGYYNADQPTNISLNFFKTDTVNNLPYNNIAALGESINTSLLQRSDLPTGAAKKDTNTGDTLLLGYHGMNFGSVNRQLFGVPLDTQPHLVSLKDFGQGSAQQQPGAGVALPPNAFMNGATGRDQRKSNKDVHMLAAAVAGINEPPIPLGLTNGYIVLDNHLSKEYQGIIPSGDTVFAQELGNQGVTVDDSSGYFERGDNDQIEQWHQTRRDVDRNGNPGFNASSDGPAWDKIFTNTGDTPTSADQVANNIPYNGSATNCNHSNSDRNSAAPNPKCVNGTESPTPGAQCPFDKALHPNPNANQPSTVQALTATEQTGCKLMDLWARATTDPTQTQANFSIPATGIGLYPAGHNPIQGQSAPWTNSSNARSGFPNGDGDSYSDPNIPCKVTKPGNFAQLVDQTVAATPDYVGGQPTSTQALAIAELIRQRMHEILPADNATILAEFNNVALKPIPLGKALFIYLDPATGFKHFKSDVDAPPWMNPRFATLKKHIYRQDDQGSQVDGRDVIIKNMTYGVAMNMADAKHQWGIHDTPFIHVNGEMVVMNASQNGDPNGNGSIVARDRVIVNANSGAFGNLLNVTFEETTQAQGNGGPTFTDRD